uniref:Uncharacterized protein n=1 Tax=Pygocentrus nattereri TaxID=42514 RepID=A0AAR2K4P1_PYGNA
MWCAAQQLAPRLTALYLKLLGENVVPGAEVSVSVCVCFCLYVSVFNTTQFYKCGFLSACANVMSLSHEGCMHQGNRHQHNSRWHHPDDPCSVCTCLEGHVQCDREECKLPCTNPPSPLPGSCCPVCDGCGMNGVNFRNGERVPSGDRCEQCVCVNGNVQCEHLPCPATICSHPVRRAGDCSCVLDDVEYDDGSVWDADGSPCNTCSCKEGTVVCQTKACASTSCLHPNTEPGECCASCYHCLYKQRIYENGQTFSDPDDSCQRCTCQDGSVRCAVAQCPSVSCSNPYTPPGQCCPQCPDCVFENQVFVNGETFPSPVNPCEDCVCTGGHVNCRQQCQRPSCNYPVSGTCCQNNCNGCSYAGKEYANGMHFPHPTDKCRECHCINGNVQCLMKRCPSLQCSNRISTPGQCCPQCPGQKPIKPIPFILFFFLHLFFSFQIFDSCQSCSCTDGKVSCHRKPCPLALCTHPIFEQCCRTCDGMICGNGERFPDPQDHCQHCSCQNGGVSCAPVSCPVVSCRRPVRPAGECCPVCTGVCEYFGQEYESGSTFTPPTDRCLSCTCLNEIVSCQRKPCAQQCSHPARSTDCCPVCDLCLYEGVEYKHTQTFTSRSNPCQRCVCMSGTVACTAVACPAVSCPNPVTLPGQCCPQCRPCVQNGIEYKEGQRWNSPSDPCTQCTCMAAEVSCAGLHCAPLSCMHQVTDPSSCCSRCRGCVYDGVEHAEGSTWFASSGPCMSCMCVDGVTTCSEIQCLSPCQNQISVPGECCPLCADCIYDGRVYGPGENFHPSNDPCQICTCEVMPDGQQHLRCYRKQCPSLVDCPKHNILFSGPDSCCPVCAQPLSNCTETLIGNEVLATDDPCFTCQCKDLTWTCIHQTCYPLSCPPDEQYTPPDSCCPICNDLNVQCVYEGQTYDSNEYWEMDECTTCTCVSGDVHCQTERCPAVSCTSDESPSLIPGMCCPHCIPRPATCIVFGDPHYRTFDGKMVNFQGACTYVLAQDCEGGDFSIHVTNDDRGRNGVSWTKEVTVFIGDVVVQLLQDWVVKVDYQTVSLPFLKEPYVYLERKTNTILLNTNIGMKVLWSGRSHLEVSVPGTYKKHMCGLCGNFNNYPQDDMRLRNGQISSSEAAFGNDWKVGSGNHSRGQCSDGRDIDPCKEAGYFARKTANSRCAVLKSAVFQRCHKVIPPEMFFASCVYDLCACGSNTDECLCDALEAYASECREAGVVLQWRSPSLCAVGCPLDRGYVFDECGPPCPKTCFNKDVPLGVIEAHCFKPCVPGCQCPAGLVQHEAHCIAPEKCPKIIYSNP